MGDRWARMFVEQGGVTQAWIAQVDQDYSARWISHWPADPILHPFPRNLIDKAIETREAVSFIDHAEFVAGAIIPILNKSRVTGLIGLLSTQTDYFTPRTMVWLHVLANMISDHLYNDERYRPQQILAEQSISHILQSSVDVRDPLPAVLELLAVAVQADAVTALCYKQSAKRLDLLASYGLDPRVPARLRLYYETGLSGKAAAGRELVWIEDMLEPPHPRSPLAQEGYRSYLALPLIGHNDFLGILEVVWRTPHPLQPWVVDFLERMAVQIAFTMERASLVEDLRYHNKELASTYHTVIEGLSRTLELRDLETEGHTRRVSKLMMRFVEYMHLPPNQWDAIRQGALLHDIGKLGIPDAILLKPGSLTPQERQVMQQHAVYGYNVLAPIIDFRQTLDIALYHHERWDGSGYPYGLKGEHIPMVARLFSVVDVFDALTSDRPYRSAWSHSQAIEYIMEQAGRQFDIQVVESFLRIVSQKT